MDGQGLPKFKGDVVVQMITHIKPNWDIREFYGLKYERATHKDADLVNQYVRSGHSRQKISLYKYHLPNPMPNCVENYIIPHFTFLDKACPAVNYFKPGQYLPLHSDIYGKYIDVHNVDPKNVVRCMVMLEDNSPGQILQVKETTYSNWKAGDCFYWNYDDEHAFYNFSLKDRYAIQVTGIQQ